MAQIQVIDLTFGYENGIENVFENVTFSIDTNWKLGLIGRNGKGKTTFLNLLLRKYEYQGTIHTNVICDYFPYTVTEDMLSQMASELLVVWKPGCEEWRVICELDKLGVDAEVLYRPFGSLSYGERTKVMLAVLFSAENDFLLIDEPTNHLDMEARGVIKQYLSGKKSYILVSHDRNLLDACIDHVLVLNRKTIEVQAGNFSSWWNNKQRADQFAQAENEKHLSEIRSLKKAADRVGRWAEKNERTKIGFDPTKEPDRCISTRAYIGAKTKKLQSQVKNFEKRIGREIQEKEGLLQDIEKPADLRLCPMSYHKERLIIAKDLSLTYPGRDSVVIQGLNMEIKRGERVFLHGANGCGKSTLLKAILERVESSVELDNATAPEQPKLLTPGQASAIQTIAGQLEVGSGLKISYINQDTSRLRGTLHEYCEENNYNESLLLALLRQLDMERRQFAMQMENYSEGQKKKVLIASSLLTAAHIYIWDEPLNYIDVFSRAQIESMLLTYQPTMLVVDHDVTFREKIATRVVEL